MRISDWSSDVCSSDLRARRKVDPAGAPRAEREHEFSGEDDRDERTQRQVPHEARTQFGEIDVEHHHDEQKQYSARAEIDDAEQHRDATGAGKQNMPSRVETGGAKTHDAIGKATGRE